MWDIIQLNHLPWNSTNLTYLFGINNLKNNTYKELNYHAESTAHQIHDGDYPNQRTKFLLTLILD